MLSTLSCPRPWLIAAISIAVASVQFTSGAHAQKGERAGKSNPQATSATIEKKKKPREIIVEEEKQTSLAGLAATYSSKS